MSSSIYPENYQRNRPKEMKFMTDLSSSLTKHTFEVDLIKVSSCEKPIDYGEIGKPTCIKVGSHIK